MKKNLTLLHMMLLCAITLKSQNFIEVIKLTHTVSSVNKFEDKASSTSRINESNADLTVPFKLKGGNAMLTGITYERIHARLFSDGTNKTVSSICLKLGANIFLNERYSATIVALPKLASDFSEQTPSNFQIGIMAFVKRKMHDRFNYRYGFYYNQERFGPFLVPIFGLYYRSMSGKFETTLMLPIQADASYEVAPHLRLGLYYNGQVRSYYFTDKNSYNRGMYLQKISNELYSYARWQITDKFSLVARVGQTFGRKFKVLDNNEKVSFGMPLLYIGDQRKQLNTNFNDGLLYQLGIVWRVSVK